MKKILIIKIGALGDVLRTTPLLRILKGRIFWVTDAKAVGILPCGYIERIFTLSDLESLKQIHFDLILSLDEDKKAAEMASSLITKQLIGVYASDSGKICYTNSSSEWFDMSLISRYGKKKADNLKLENKKSYQEILFRMLGRKFSGEEYLINYSGSSIKSQIIGIEKRTGDVWPTKQWNNYERLARLLTNDGYRVRFFRQRKTLSQYIKDIDETEIIVTGDTLAMHIGLALRKKIVAIFTCTSPHEIYGYGRTIKIISPLLPKAFYKKEYISSAVNAVPIREVYSVVHMIADKNE